MPHLMCPALPAWVALCLMRVRGSQPAFESGSWKSCIGATRLSPYPCPQSPFTWRRPHLTVAVGVPPGNPILEGSRTTVPGRAEVPGSRWGCQALPVFGNHIAGPLSSLQA